MRIHHTAVVGAGNMGSGIAQKIATEGYPVWLVDRDLASANAGKQRISTLLSEAVERNILTPQQREQALERVRPTADLKDLADVDLVIEAIFEDKQAKRSLFEQLADICKPSCILATNTSSFLVADLAKGIKNAERVIGLHYFYHPAKNRLVEVIGHAESSPSVLKAAWAFQECIAKTPIASLDAPGFVVNRFFVPWLNEALRLHAEGVSIATIEAAAKRAFGVGMGPFELMNVTGVPITLHAADSLSEQLGPFYRADDSIRHQVEQKLDWSLDGDVAEAETKMVSDRLLGVVFHVATQLVSEEVCTIEDADIGARVGLRWPKGPFELMNEYGIESSAAFAADIERRYDLAQPAVLKTQLSHKEGFTFERVSYHREERVGIVTLRRPDHLNALDPETMRQLSSCMEQAWEDSACTGVVIRGAGKAFVAGADVKFFVEHIKQNKIDSIYAFASDGQALFRKIETSSKPTVCLVDGLALGGGAELALACQAVVVTPKAVFGFPETGIGIYPGLGGTQRTAHKGGEAVARWLIGTGAMLDASTLCSLGLADTCVEQSEAVDAAVGHALKLASEELQKGTKQKPAPQLQAMLKLFEDCSLLDIFDTKTADENPVHQKLVKKVKQKARNALRLADDLIAYASEHSLEDGLAKEMESLKVTFAHPNALEGMTALLERRRPDFKQVES